MQPLQVRHPLTVHVRVSTLLKHLAHLGIGESRVGVDHALIEMKPIELSGAGEIHLAHQCQSIHRRFERTETV